MNLQQIILVLTFVATTSVALAHGHGGGNVPATGQFIMQEDPSVVDKACREGAPASADEVAHAHTRIERLMTAYFALTPKSSVRDVEDLFSSEDGTHWRTGTTDVPINDIASHLGTTAPQRTLLVMVVGGDDQSARAIWSTSATADAPAQFYGADFLNGGWISGWKIWHLSIMAAKPDTPAAYCHFIGGDQSF